MGQDEIRLGLIGCGGISHFHARAAKNSRHAIRFVACCDIRPDAAEAWAKQCGCERFCTDFEAMLRTERLHGVLLATWPNQHREQIERCLAAGARNILCEKALTLTGKEAAEILTMANAANAFVMEGFMYRHHPAIRKLETILATGELGPVDNVRAAFHSFDPEMEPGDSPNRNWRQRRECGGGIPYDLACYAVNACGHFTGSVPARAFASGNVSPKYGTVNRLYGMIEYANGTVGIIESSKKSSFNQELQVTCANGILHVPVAWTLYDASAIRQFRCESCGTLLTDTYAIRQADAYQLQLENFAAVIRGQEKPVVPLAQSVANTFAVEALVTSLLEKRIVDVNVPASVAKAIARQG